MISQSLETQPLEEIEPVEAHPVRTRPQTPPNYEQKPSPETPRLATRVAPKRRWWLSLLLWLLFLGAVGGGGYVITTHIIAAKEAATSAAGKAAAPRATPVVTAMARKASMPIYLTGLGTVTPNATVAIHSRVDGELKLVKFKEGDPVIAGETIAQIDSRPFQAQLDQAEGNLAKDQANLKSAQLDLNRYRPLVDNKSITQQQYDQQVALVDQFKGAITTDQGVIDSAQLQITYSNITAPISGRIGLRKVDQGNMVHATDVNPLAVITQLQPIDVLFTVPQDDIVRVQKAMASNKTLTVEAYDRDLQNKLDTGTLLAIDNQVDPTTGTLLLKAVFKNENNMLFPNQFVNARLLIDTLQEVVVVPTAAIQRGPDDSTFVYLVKNGEQKTVDLRDIKLGPTEGDQTVITSGLAAGDVVVTDGVDKLQPGSKVTTAGKKSGGGHAKGAKVDGKDTTQGNQSSAENATAADQNGSSSGESSKANGDSDKSGNGQGNSDKSGSAQGSGKWGGKKNPATKE